MKTPRGIVPFAAALGAVWLAGCATPQTRISDNPAAFAQLPPDQQSLVREGKVAVGFTRDAVRLAVGSPDLITLHTDATGETETWHYAFYGYYDGPAPFYVSGDYYRHGWWGPRWGARFYDDYPYPPTPDGDRLTVEFRNGVVTSVTQAG